MSLGITSKSFQRYVTLKDLSFYLLFPLFHISATICLQKSRNMTVSPYSVFYSRPRGQWWRLNENIECYIRHFVKIIAFFRQTILTPTKSSFPILIIWVEVIYQTISLSAFWILYFIIYIFLTKFAVWNPKHPSTSNVLLEDGMRSVQ